MTVTETKNLIRMGFEPSSYFKRGTWTKIERVMEFLRNKGLVERLCSDIKYRACEGYDTAHVVDEGSRMYMESPFINHYEDILALAKSMGKPLNSGEVLDAFININK